MKEIIEKLKEWQENINYDIKVADEPVGTALVQSLHLASAIGLLESVGKNNNIPE